VVALGDYVLWGLLSEDGFLQQMVRETSWQCVGGWFVGWNTPFLIVVGIVMLLPRRFRRPGHRRRCRYNLAGNVSGRCPECGAVTSSEQASLLTRAPRGSGDPVL
jgi:hypothetical protein